MLYFPDGNSIEVPLIGCSDDRPDCCPGIVNKHTTFSTPSTSTGYTATTTPTATGVVAAMNQNPLTVCPRYDLRCFVASPTHNSRDMVDIDPVCCPSGYKLFGQSIIGNMPCFSVLTSSVIQLPTSVVASISSAVISSISSVGSGVSSSAASVTTVATPTVSVIINEIFALGLPCAEEEGGSSHSGLSTGAKVGIGLGSAGAFLLLLLLWAFLAAQHKKHKKEKETAQGQTPNQPWSPTSKHISAVSTMPPVSPINSQNAYTAQQQHQVYGYPSPGGTQTYASGQTFPSPHQGWGHDSMMSTPSGYPHSGSYQPGFLPSSPPVQHNPHLGPRVFEVDGGPVMVQHPHIPEGKIAEVSGSESGARDLSEAGTGTGGQRWGSSTTRT